MRPRLLVLPIAAVIIAGLCAWKLSRIDEERTRIRHIPQAMRPAPPFELYDDRKPSQIVRLKSYLGRHRVLVAFFDGEAGADRSPVLLRLKRDFDRLDREDVKVFAISDAIPQHNRAASARAGGFPFPLLTDLTRRAHEDWGLADPKSGELRQGVFVIDRAGNVAWDKTHPRPVDDPNSFLSDLIDGN